MPPAQCICLTSGTATSGDDRVRRLQRSADARIPDPVPARIGHGTHAVQSRCETRAWGFGTTPLSQETLLSAHDRDVPLLTWRRSLGGGDTFTFVITGSITNGEAHLSLRTACHVDDMVAGFGATRDEQWRLVVPVDTTADFTIAMTDDDAPCAHIWGSVANREVS